MAGDDGIRRDWIEKDYYKILGVPKDADAAAIKKKYRKLARELHPDANPDDKKAEERFKAVSEAYDVVGDADQRIKYDEMRKLVGSGGGRFSAPGGQGGFGAPDLSDMFGRAGGSGGFSDAFGGLFNRGGSRRAPRRGADIESEVTLGFTDALHGVTLPLRLSSEGPCDTCAGSGAKPGTSPRVCPNCQGTGATVRNQGGFAFSEPCQLCRGRGVIIDDPCPTCHGSGQALSTRTVTARIPAGVKNGQKIRLKGKGAPGDHGAPNGDLFIVIHVTPHPVFGREGKNVTLSLPVSFDEAALGANVKVPTPDGRVVTLKLPPGTSNARTFRIKGKGAPSSTGDGDLLVTVQVVVPPALSDQARAAVESLREAFAGQDPRAELMKQAGGA